MSRQVLGWWWWWRGGHCNVFPHVLNRPKALYLWGHRWSNFRIFPCWEMGGGGGVCAGMKEHGLSKAGADSASAQGPRGVGGGGWLRGQDDEGWWLYRNKECVVGGGVGHHNPFCCILSGSRHTGRVAGTGIEGLPSQITNITTPHTET